MFCASMLSFGWRKASVFSYCVAQTNKRVKKPFAFYWVFTVLFDAPQCPVSQHEFVSAEYLQSHIHRRHPEHLSLARREGEEKKK